MVDSIVSFAIQKLDDFVTQKVRIRTGVNNGVEWLRAELAFLLASAGCAEARQEEELIRLWINSINDVANEALIILDRFNSQQKEYTGFDQGILDRMRGCVCICKKEANLYDIGQDLESLKEKVILIKNRRDEYGIGNILAIPNVQRRKRSLLRATSFENNVEVVGFKDDVQTLMAQLRKRGTLGMISIHGMGGLGKSTLASKLYHSTKLTHFTSRAWVCVSEDYSIEHVLRKIIKCFNGHEDSLQKMEEEDLLRHLRKVLQASGCYLVVIDDIWDLKVWEKIKNAFPRSEGCRVIITTRDKKVAEGVDDKCFVHKLRFLSEDESWQLFCKRAKPTQNLEEMGKEMVGKCRGLPLAIVVLSGLLLHQKSYKDWSRVKNHIWRRLKDDSVEIGEILSLSYNDLPFKMKQCFLYLARFPEDHIFEVDRLMQLWIAEEFISEADEGDGVFMEDMAEHYLSELINRNIIETARFRFNGIVYKCRIHDLVRDLAMQKAREQGLLDIFDTSKQLPNPSSFREKRRHVVYNGIGEYLLLEPNSDDFKLRSVALTNETESYVEIEVIKLAYVRFRYLKVLDLSHVKSDQIPEEVGDLVLLKFLGLMASHDHGQALVIPPAIGKLTKLQTLRGSASSTYEAPREICELKELRHLSSLGCKPEPERGGLNIGSNQTKLQTLDVWCYVNWIHIETVKLTNLHALSIQDYTLDEHPLDSISNLTSLQTFYINFALGNVVPTIKPLSFCKCLNSVFLRCTINDPSELKFLPDSVTILSLTRIGFKKDPMPVLGNLPNLANLVLVQAYRGEKMICSRNSFPNLQYLALSYLSNLRDWQVEEGALTSLQGLGVDHCKNLTVIPPQVERIPPLPAMFMLWEYR